MPWFHIRKNWSVLPGVTLLERKKERACKGKEPCKNRRASRHTWLTHLQTKFLYFHSSSLVCPLLMFPHLPNLWMFQSLVFNFSFLPKYLSLMISFNLMASNTIYVLKACDLYLQSALLLNFQTHIFLLMYLIRSSNLRCPNWAPSQSHSQTCFSQS